MSSKRKTSSMTLITNNQQSYIFSLSLNTSKNSVKITAKHKTTKDTFHTELNSDKLKKLGFYHSLKGFYNRLKTALESKNPKELRAYYWFYDNKLSSSLSPHETSLKKTKPSSKKDNMLLVLEESSKYDDNIKWKIPLSQLEIKETVKLHEKLEDVVEVVDNRDKKLKEQMNFIVQQVKQKFDSEKEKRQLLEEKVKICESAIKKLGKMYKELQNKLNVSEEQVDIGKQATAENLQKMNSLLEEKMTKLEEKLNIFESTFKSELYETNRIVSDLRPKLARLKSRKDFNNEQAYIEYIGKKINEWDSKSLGPILIRVNPETAKGKAKHFIGYVGEPIKWNSSICKVQWYGVGKKQPESIQWSCLDVYLPLSAFYYPDCPHANRPKYSNTNIEKL